MLPVFSAIYVTEVNFLWYCHFMSLYSNSGGRSIECNGDMPAAAAAGGEDARRSLRHHHLCNWELCCNN